MSNTSEPPKTWERAKKFMHEHTELFHGLSFETRLRIQNAIDSLIYRAIEDDRFALRCRFQESYNEESVAMIDALVDP